MSELLPIKSLKALRAAEEECTRCPLYKHAIQVVPGEGPARARLYDGSGSWLRPFTLPTFCISKM